MTPSHPIIKDYKTFCISFQHEGSWTVWVGILVKKCNAIIIRSWALHKSVQKTAKLKILTWMMNFPLLLEFIPYWWFRHRVWKLKLQQANFCKLLSYFPNWSTKFSQFILKIHLLHNIPSNEIFNAPNVHWSSPWAMDHLKDPDGKKFCWTKQKSI